MTEDKKMLPASGQLWKAKQLVICEHGSIRRVVVEKDEVVEFRYWSPCNFRTTDELYLTLSEEDFISNFDYCGDIFNEVRSANRNSLRQIMDAELYTKVRQ